MSYERPEMAGGLVCLAGCACHRAEEEMTSDVRQAVRWVRCALLQSGGNSAKLNR